MLFSVIERNGNGTSMNLHSDSLKLVESKLSSLILSVE